MHFKWNLHPYNVGLINQTKVSLIIVLPIWSYHNNNDVAHCWVVLCQSYNPGQGTK